MTITRTPAARKSSNEAARARAEDNVRKLEHIGKSLEAAEDDLASIGSSLGVGVRDLSRDLNRLLRDARRDLTKMRGSVQRDLDRLQKDLTTAATARPPARSVRRPAQAKKTPAAHAR